jgi:acetyltransferase-like isoleucine patch superfamily enzyme
MPIHPSEPWYDGVLPENLVIGKGSSIETTFGFRRFFSRREPGLILGSHVGIYANTYFDVGIAGQVVIGDYSMITCVFFRCEERIEIGRRVMISWQVGLLDSHALPRCRSARADAIQKAAAEPHARLPRAEPAPIVIEDDVWIGFGSVVLPGVRIGAGSVIGAKSVVTRDVPAGVIAAGNPARVIRRLGEQERVRTEGRHAS